jgi:hypothetical protein
MDRPDSEASEPIVAWSDSKLITVRTRALLSRLSKNSRDGLAAEAVAVTQQNRSTDQHRTENAWRKVMDRWLGPRQ